MGLLERWDRRNEDWARDRLRSPDRPTGVRILVVVGVAWLLATVVASVLGAAVVATVSALKATLFLAAAVAVDLHLRAGRRS
jgi:hypothetical protein